MHFAVGILAFSTKPFQWWTAFGYALLLLVAMYALLLWLGPSRTKALAAVASGLRLQFDPKMSRERLCIRGATFDTAIPPRNCMRGTLGGREIVIFDQTMPIAPVSRPAGDNGTAEQTVVGFRVAASAYCRDRGILQPSAWHVEKFGEWVFVYGRTGLVKPSAIKAYVEEAGAWFERATDPNGYEPTVLAGSLG